MVWVVDSADKRRLDACRAELHSLLGQEKLAGATLLIFANKQDLAGALSPEQISEALDLNNEIFERRHWAVEPCSAATGDGLLKGVGWIVDDVAKRVFLLD